MLPLYESNDRDLEVYLQKSEHVAPHLHQSLEIVYVTEGTLEVGVGVELFHMEKGDLALVFPGLVHHYQVFSASKSRHLVIIASPSLTGPYQAVLDKYSPRVPVLKSEAIHEDIRYAFKVFLRDYKVPGRIEDLRSTVLIQAWLDIILANCLPLLELVDKSTLGSDDIIYRTIAYVAEHFREPITLTGMAHDLGYSPFSLSRVFSGTFHRNFNKYVNEVRLTYASSLLIRTNESITDIAGNSGFESLRTFNRAFRDFAHMTPSQYRAAATDSRKR
ncbi:MAG: AraC family transcriptional regulator [Eubacterium sp.]|nr:AraC family transcriptional regulator [Eubacterium sp.]